MEQLKEEWRGHVAALVARYAGAEAATQAGIIAIVEEDWGDAASEALADGFAAAREQKVNRPEGVVAPTPSATPALPRDGEEGSLAAPSPSRVYRRERRAAPGEWAEYREALRDHEAAPVAKAKPEPEVEPPAEADAEPKARAEAISRARPRDAARLILSRFMVDGVSRLRCQGGEFWLWEGGTYERQSNAAITKLVSDFLDGARTMARRSIPSGATLRKS